MRPLRVPEWLRSMWGWLVVAAAALGLLVIACLRYFFLGKREGEVRGSAAERLRRVRQAGKKGDLSVLDEEWKRK